MSSEEPKRVVETLWNALGRKDWDGLRAVLSPEALYEDVATPDTGARGPDNIVRRLRIAFDHVDRYDHDVHRLVAEGATVILEHTEVWHFKSGEKVTNPFVSVHDVRDGRVVLWRDYWDVSSFTQQFPEWFLKELAKHAGEEFGG